MGQILREVSLRSENRRIQTLTLVVAASLNLPGASGKFRTAPHPGQGMQGLPSLLYRRDAIAMELWELITWLYIFGLYLVAIAQGGF